MTISTDTGWRKWGISALLGIVIAYSAGTIIASVVLSALGPTPSGEEASATPVIHQDLAIFLPILLQLLTAIVVTLVLAQIRPPLRRWAWASLILGVVFLLTLPVTLLLSEPATGALFNGQADSGAMTALFFTLLIFGIPLLALTMLAFVAAFILFRRSKSA